MTRPPAALHLLACGTALLAAACGWNRDVPLPSLRDGGAPDTRATIEASSGADAASDQGAHVPDAGPTPWRAPTVMPEIPAYTPYDANVLLLANEKPFVPVLPALRASADGRVAVSSIASTSSIRALGTAVEFFLFQPERYTKSFSATTGSQMVDPLQVITLPASQFESHVPASDGGLDFRTVCDDTTRNNPQPCAADPAMDCYQLNLVAAYRYAGTGLQPFELWSTPITVSVKNPKTPTARMASITTGTPVKSPTTFMGNAFNQPSITEDGRLLVGDKRGEAPDQFSIVYAVNPAGSPFAGCDARGWTRLWPVSNMSSDPDMKPYGVAAYPLRDTEGTIIPSGHNLNADYPWMDRKGRNLCFTTLVDPLYYVDGSGNPRSRFPVVGCPAGATCKAPTAADITNGFEDQERREGVACAGLWTHGKTVLLNGRLNNGDFGLGLLTSQQRIVQLYEDHTGKDPSALGQVVAGNNFYGVTAFPGGADNSADLDSIEHRFNFLPNLQPLGLARADVVWIVASGKTAQEVAFDPFINPSSFILSSGLGTVTNEAPSGPGMYNDGFDRPSIDPIFMATTGNGLVRAPRVHNAATAVSPEVVAASGGALPASAARWRIPSYGVPGGDVRIEPVNAGGVAGIERGLWLSGGGSVRYEIPDQPDAAALASTPWYAGVFLDSRPAASDSSGTARRILTFPDGSVLDLVGLETLRFGDPAKPRTVTLPAPAPKVDWVHLALLSTPTSLSLYENGFLFATVDTTGAPLFRIARGTLTLGEVSGTAGFRGWMDRLEVYADAPNPEVACNRAMGTLVSVSATTGALHDQAARYPAFAHSAIGALLPGSSRAPLYACYSDYATEFGANLNDVPAGSASLRSAILFPEGPMVWNAPRPDSSRNAFCLGCHAPDLPPTLQPSALTFDAALTEFADPRRRPMQAAPTIWGNVPASWLGPALPPAASGVGLNLDSYLYPAP